MSTQRLGYLGGGVLVAIIIVTLLGVPPEVWMSVAIVAGLIGLIALVVVHQAQADGTDLAHRFLARQREAKPTRSTTGRTAVEHAPDVEVELVRAPDVAAATPAVWLHRRGGRRVHRFSTGAGWTVQRVSTKDPDNPRKRVIGQSLTFASEADAVAAANDLARGLEPAKRGRAMDARMTAEARA
jgi:hypothetical protein